ncbi:aminotransferase class I/II-fold pyridoxal phosphate-dependent enzyme, partial [Raoultella terrigena]|uniref:aminotransferase class I/II-fold pyridoxal phosphate-dependent enzyme n=1 Tax=Raoultella terrigena TaxID=577 RepID=UPI001330D768
MVPLTDEHRHDLDAMAAAITDRTKVVLVCTPNNPTGPSVTHTELVDFIAKVPSHVLVVVDEASMLSLTMTARLLEALRPTARLLLVGDPDQLASVEAGAVLADLVAGYGDGGESPVARLRTSHRFGEEIGALAEAVRVGDADGAIAILTAASPGGPVRHVPVEHVLEADEALRPRLLDHARRLRTLALDGAHPAALRELGEHRLLCAHRDGPWGVGCL